LDLIGGLDDTDDEEVVIGGQPIMHMGEEELTIFRRRNIGFVFQNYNLISVLNV
jgi:putative ABC transport system ATP-binding protein